MRALCLVFTLFLSQEVMAKSMLPQLGEGRPGCFELIRNQALSESQIKALPPDCQNLRSDYFSALNQVSANPQSFANQLNSYLAASTGARAPYEAILFAFLINQEKIKTGLLARAKTEKKLKLPFQYAVLSLELLKGKECADLDRGFFAPEYQELCTSKDSILSQLYAAHQKPVKGSKR